jgi:hypothetical protein
MPLPSYVVVRMAGYSEDFDPSVQRTEMERGPPKERRLNSQVLMRLSLSFLFRTSADAESFLDWYEDTIGRIGYFTMTHPRTGATITAKFPGGNIGSLRSITGTDHLWQRDLAVEYLR